MVTMNEDLLINELFSFIRKQLKLPNSFKLSLDTYLEKELNVYGDLADDFFYELKEHFNLKVDNDFNLDGYFSPEQNFVQLSLISLRIYNKKSKNYKDMNIRQLLLYIIEGRLYSPEFR